MCINHLMYNLVSLLMCTTHTHLVHCTSGNSHTLSINNIKCRISREMPLILLWAVCCPSAFLPHTSQLHQEGCRSAEPIPLLNRSQGYHQVNKWWPVIPNYTNGAARSPLGLPKWLWWYWVTSKPSRAKHIPQSRVNHLANKSSIVQW